MTSKINTNIEYNPMPTSRRRRNDSSRESTRRRSLTPSRGFRSSSRNKLIPSKAFYSNYHGHTVQHLKAFEEAMRPKPKPPMRAFAKQFRDAIWLAGDSSLDNKHWFPEDEAPVVNNMECTIMEQNKCRRDIAWWLNKKAEDRHYSQKVFAINSSYEEGKIESRSRGRLLPQDEYLRDNLRPEDFVIVSVGGNDVALFPQLPCTIVNMAILNLCTPQICLDNACGCALPCDDYLWGKSLILIFKLMCLSFYAHFINVILSFYRFLTHRILIWLCIELLCLSVWIRIHGTSLWNSCQTIRRKLDIEAEASIGGCLCYIFSR